MRLPDRMCWASFLVLLSALAYPLRADEEKPVPDFTRGGEKDDQQDWTLGPTGARGWIWAQHLSSSKARQILITQVDEGSPAAGVLQPDDVILGVGGRLFDRDARIAFGEAITLAESNAGQGNLPLVRWRRGRRENVTLKLEVMGDYGPTAPFGCPKSQRVLEKSLQFLSRQKLQPGELQEMRALALLATGKPEYANKLKRFAGDMVKYFAEPGVDYQMNWHTSFENIFLCEYFLVTRDESVLPTIRQLSLRLARTQSASGSWGHYPPLPHSVEGRLEGYGAVNSVGLICWLSLVLAQKCGVNDPAIATAAEKSRVFYRFYGGKGSIPYGDHPVVLQWHDDNGKNANAAIAFDLIQDHVATRYFARLSTAAYLEREGGHTGNYFHLFWGPLGVSRLGPEAVAAHLRPQRWYYDLSRSWKGSYPYQGNPGEGDSYDGWDTTAVFVLTNCLPLQRLHITGKGIHAENSLTGEALASTVQAGSDYDHGRLDTCYEHRPTAQLLDGLSSWSPIVRHRSAKALAARDENYLPRLNAMLRGNSLPAKQGACLALQYSGEKGGPGVDALVALLEDPDIWTRICAANALAGIGEPAKRAAPAILQARLKPDPNDPRGMLPRYLTMALFDGYSGLMRDSIEGLDRGQLREAIKLTLFLPDGLSRKGASSAYGHLNQEDLAELWPYIVRSIMEPAPSGEMFADEIRVSGCELLANRKIKEGPALIVEYARHQSLWASQERIDPIMKALTSYGSAAKDVLPELEALIPYFEQQDFPDDPKAKKIGILKDAIKTIQEATDGPKRMRSIATLVPAEYFQPRAVFESLQPAQIIGTYKMENAANDWHTGELKVAAEKAGDFPTFTWTNQAGVSWQLVLDRENGQLRCAADSPYFDDVENGRAFRLLLRHGKAGKYFPNVTAFRFGGELYVKQ